MTMDLVAINAYGRPLVQPSASNPASQGIRQIDDPREAVIPASPLAARNSADLRQSVGPRQSSSSGAARDDEEHGTVQGKGRSGSVSGGRNRHPSSEDEGDTERGSTLDVTV
jgi:hypothetical protein